jgi:hypothetical protein
MLQKFLNGKKKYSAFIITVLSTLIPLFIQEPEAQATFMDMVPSIAVLVAGIFYIVTEGGLDKKREEAKVAIAQAQAAIVSEQAAFRPQNSTAAQPAQPKQEIQPMAAAQPQPLDIKLFHERVLNDTAAKYSEQNPATVFSEAKDKGSVTTCHDIKQAQDYWDYLVTLSYDAEQYVREATGIDKPGPCKVRSPEHVAAQLEVSKTIRCRDFVYALAQTAIDWKRKISPNDTLYHVGVLAGDLLASSSR